MLLWRFARPAKKSAELVIPITQKGVGRLYVVVGADEERKQ